MEDEIKNFYIKEYNIEHEYRITLLEWIRDFCRLHRRYKNFALKNYRVCKITGRQNVIKTLMILLPVSGEIWINREIATDADVQKIKNFWQQKGYTLCYIEQTELIVDELMKKIYEQKKSKSL